MDSKQSVSELHQRALAAHRAGRLEEAAAGYEAALLVEPDHAASIQLRGVVHLQQGKAAEAVVWLRRAVDASPTDAGTLSNLASALIQLERYEEAAEAGERAIALDPRRVDAIGNLAVALTRSGHMARAAKAYASGLVLAPDNPAFHSGLALALGKLDRFEEALAAHNRALALAPGQTRFLNNLTVTLRDARLDAEAESILRQLVEQDPADGDFAVALADVMRKRGRVAEAVDLYRRARESGASLNRAENLRFLSNYVGNQSISAMLEEAKAAGRTWTDGIAALPPPSNAADSERRLRIGFISGDFRQHAVSRFLPSVLAELRQLNVDIFIYSAQDNGDAVNRQLRNLLANWRSIGDRDDAGVASLIRGDSIDIMVDLSGPTRHSRLAVFAYRPAPIAVTWLGYSGTTGLEQIDYILGDEIVLPVGVDQTFEIPWRLPDAYLCYTPAADRPEPGPLPALRHGGITFGSLNNTNKLSSETLDVWAAILKRVPTSRLLLKGGARERGAVDATNLAAAFRSRGIKAGRVDVLGWFEGWNGHFSAYREIDIALDPFPYNGTTTTCDALSMGVPVLTLTGDRFISRVTTSILANAGLDGWIARSVDDYVNRAVSFAVDLDGLARLRSGLRQQFTASPVCDARRFAQNLEEAFRGMWRIWCQQHR